MKINEMIAHIDAWLRAIPQDKLLHFIAGAGITAVVAVVRPLALVAWVVGVGAGIGKELYDWRKWGKLDTWDAVATAIGAVTMQIFLAICLICWKL